MRYCRQSVGLVALGIALLVGCHLDVRWPFVLLAASSAALFSSWITGYGMSWPIGAGASIVGGAAGSVIMGYLVFPWINVHSPPHLVFFLVGCSIGLAIHVLLGPRRDKNRELYDVYSCVRSGVTIVILSVLMGPFVCLVTWPSPVHLILSPFVGGIAGLLLACPFAIEAMWCRSRSSSIRGNGQSRRAHGRRRPKPRRDGQLD